MRWKSFLFSSAYYWKKASVILRGVNNSFTFLWVKSANKASREKILRGNFSSLWNALGIVRKLCHGKMREIRPLTPLLRYSSNVPIINPLLTRLLGPPTPSRAWPNFRTTPYVQKKSSKQKWTERKSFKARKVFLAFSKKILWMKFFQAP